MILRCRSISITDLFPLHDLFLMFHKPDNCNIREYPAGYCTKIFQSVSNLGYCVQQFLLPPLFRWGQGRGSDQAYPSSGQTLEKSLFFQFGVNCQAGPEGRKLQVEIQCDSNFAVSDQPSKPKQVLFFFRKSFAGIPRKNFVNFDGIANFLFGQLKSLKEK